MYEKPEGIEQCRIWVDGCFDFAHHGHAGAMLQARQLGRELYVGVHSDEDILQNKGPVVMLLEERIKAVEACKWCTMVVPGSPYVTDPRVMEEYGCEYVVHGDDITTDANGEDCYQVVKDLGKFVVVKRTPNILTTDLVGRMLLMSKEHHFRPVKDIGNHELFSNGEYLDKVKSYASDETGLRAGSGVYAYVVTSKSLHTLVEPSAKVRESYNNIFYIDGGFDLFHPGHIEALKQVKQRALQANAAVVVGAHDDKAINQVRGLNFPIMNIAERTLCILQCRYVDGIVLGAPYKPDLEYLNKLPGTVTAVFHGPTTVEKSTYAALAGTNLLTQIGAHDFDYINTDFIVNRVLSNKAAYEERQRRKGWKAQVEKELQEKEKQENLAGKELQ